VDSDPSALNDLLDRAAHATAATLFSQVDPLFRGRSLAIEVGIGADPVILGHAHAFDRLRAVDADPRALALLQESAARQGIRNLQTFALDAPWDEPTGAADYVFARDLFARTANSVESASLLQRISTVLRRGGIAQIRFDTRPVDLAYRVRKRLGGADRSVRRLESWVRDRTRGADLEVIGERGAGTAEHWVVARRR